MHKTSHAMGGQGLPLIKCPSGSSRSPWGSGFQTACLISSQDLSAGQRAWGLGSRSHSLYSFSINTL